MTFMLVENAKFLMVDGHVYSHKVPKPTVDVMGECGLCGQFKKLARGHINPKWGFVSPKTFMGTKVDSTQGTKVQDGEWFYVLCIDCDNWLGRYEAKLKECSTESPSDFRYFLYYREISVALLGIFLKASLASVYRGTRNSWNISYFEWAKALLLKVKSNETAGLKKVAESVRWSGIKSFSLGGAAYASQISPEVHNPFKEGISLGRTFITGMRWTLYRGMGKHALGVSTFDEGDPFSDNIGRATAETLSNLVNNLLDSCLCPCGKYSRGALAGHFDVRNFGGCCKEGWLKKPVVPGFYIDVVSKDTSAFSLSFPSKFTGKQ